MLSIDRMYSGQVTWKNEDVMDSSIGRYVGEPVEPRNIDEVDRCELEAKMNAQAAEVVGKLLPTLQKYAVNLVALDKTPKGERGYPEETVIAKSGLKVLGDPNTDGKGSITFPNMGDGYDPNEPNTWYLAGIRDMRAHETYHGKPLDIHVYPTEDLHLEVKGAFNCSFNRETGVVTWDDNALKALHLK